MRILIAEDDRITRRSLQRQLEGWGHDVVSAEDGAEAWERFLEDQFDIVVTDWEMPRVDGRELVERIRGSDKSGYVYIIMLTSRAETTDLVVGMEAGADDFLAKPFDKNELRVRLVAGERIVQLERKLAAQNQFLSNANDRMKRDLDAAADIQQALLPNKLPEGLRARFAWHYEPCDELGGDTLNVLPLDDRYVAMYLLDVTGHGVPAALLSVTLSRVLTTRGPSSSLLIAPGAEGQPLAIRSPDEVAERLNRQFPMAVQGGRFFTMVYALLDTETGQLRYTLAGQMPPIVVRRGGAPEQLAGSGFPIGVIEQPEFDVTSLQLESGDRVLFYSDGIPEARNRHGAMLGAEGFVGLIDASSDQPLHESLSACMKGLRRWSDPVPFDDDISVLALEMLGTE